MSKDYHEIIKTLENTYPDILSSAKSDKEKRILASLYNLASFGLKRVNQDTLKYAFEISKEYEPKNLNDLYSLVFIAAREKQGFSKVAYPQLPLIISDDYDSEFNINKWAKLVYKIYDAVLSEDMTLHNAIDYYAGTLGSRNQEDLKFKKWVKYYLDGENNKYAEKDEGMKKQSNFQFGLNGSNFYYPESIPVPEQEKEVSVKEKFDNEVQDAKKRQEGQDWKRKLDGAIRRIDKLIRSIDLAPEIVEELFNSLHAFNMTAHRVKNNVTASDITIRTANNFKKMGFNEAHDILLKTAQEIDPGPEEIVDEIETAPDESPGDIREEAAAVEPLPEEAPVDTAPSADPVERAYENVSGAKEGEYEKLSQDVDLSDAIAKLEEVAARLSDRRVIRLLAEFDIMLDKIGIATMFPELSESQSKLIDAYSYSMVRVTKMLGMLSSGKNLSEISDARKKEMTANVRKEVNKTFAPPEPEAPRGEEVIKEEFEEAPPVEPVPAPTPEQ